MKMVQECLTYIDKIPDKDTKIKLVETLSFVTEGKPYLNAETALLISILSKINEEEEESNPVVHELHELHEPANEVGVQKGIPINFMEDNEREMVNPKRRKPLDAQAKEIVYNLTKYFNDLKNKDMSTIFDTASSRLVATATGLPWSNVKKVMLEGRRVEQGEQGGEFSSPKGRLIKKITISDSDRAILRESIIDYYYEYYNKDEDFPTMKALHQQMKEKINYAGSYTKLRQEVSAMGFYWKSLDTRSGILVEKHEIRFLRINFLSKIAEYRSQGRPIVYTGETFVDTSNTPKGSAKGYGLVIVHAGGMDGYIENALHMFEASRNIDESLHYLSSDDYIQWMTDQLIPNLKPNSVVVIDNPFYQNLLHNPAPGPHARKQEMFDWLDYRNIVYSPSMLKPQLYQLILLHKDRCKEYKIDSILRNNNHSVLRLPAYHPELNPIRKIWPLIKRVMEKRKDLTNVRKKIKLAEEKINSITTQQWKNLCDLAIKEEKKFIGHDSAIDALTEKLTSNENESSDESETELDIDHPMSVNE